MGQVLTRESQHDENAGDAGDEGGLYRSRSARSFADITVGNFRRNFRRVRQFFSRKSRTRALDRPEAIELSSMADSPVNTLNMSFMMNILELSEINEIISSYKKHV